MSLTGKTLANTYKDLLQVDNSNNGIGTATRNIKDGEGTGSCAYISDDNLVVRPQNDDTTKALRVRAVDGTTVLAVDTTNQLVVASGNNVNTQYATFSVGNSNSSSFASGNHHPLPFNGSYGSLGDFPTFGSATEPKVVFSTAEGGDTRASCLVPCLWYLPDAISIDSITSIEGADTATGDTTRMHLFSYDFTSGSTSALTNGTLLAHNSDVTNAGSEQAYLSSWTVDSAAVASGKVILAFFQSDSINSDYSINITVKYHLT
tara:strand:- start:16869 stop:17654 length:786 start_codon:yes stop_codon:yes gene_type:complete